MLVFLFRLQAKTKRSTNARSLPWREHFDISRREFNRLLSSLSFRQVLFAQALI